MRGSGRTLYREVERLVLDDVPWITQHYHTSEYLYQPYVQGVEGSHLLLDRTIPLKKIWLDKRLAEGSRAATPAAPRRQ